MMENICEVKNGNLIFPDSVRLPQGDIYVTPMSGKTVLVFDGENWEKLVKLLRKLPNDVYALQFKRRILGKCVQTEASKNTLKIPGLSNYITEERLYIKETDKFIILYSNEQEMELYAKLFSEI